MKIFFLLCGLLWHNVGYAQAPLVLVVGDSLSAAYGIAPQQGWVTLLQQRLRAQQYPHQVINASISGETTSGGLSRLPALLEQHNPAVVILALGANDGLRAFPPQQIEAQLSRLVELSQAADAAVLLCGIRLPPNYGPAYTQRFEAIFPALAAQLKVRLVPQLLAGVGENLELMQADGLHPIAAAQPKLLETVWTGLRELLPTPPVP